VYNDKKVLAIIPARGGSKGIQHKNIVDLCGKPLLAYTIDAALKSKYIDRVIVSTDDQKIADVAKQNGAEVPFIRPKELAADTTPTEPVLRHAIKWLEDNENFTADAVVTLEPTSPLRSKETIDRSIEQFFSSKSGIDSVVTVTEDRSCFGTLDGNNTFTHLFKNQPRRRQDRTPLYKENSAIYVTKKDVIINQSSVLGKKTKAIIIDEVESLDIDVPFDLCIAEAILKNRGGVRVEKVKMYDRLVGDGEPCFIIMDACVNHNGSVETAKRMIESAKENGADAIKFQLHMPEKEMLENVPQSYNFDEPLFKLLKRIDWTIDQHKEVMDYCKKVGINYLCTPFSVEAADILDDMGVDAFKTGSGEMTNLPMLEHIAKKGKPMIVSTGMSEIPEIVETVNALKKFKVPLIITNCTSAYPTKYKDVNLNVIPKLKKLLDVPVGHSDHSLGIYTSFGAVAVGACLIEKHFTLDRSQKGPDHKVSIEPHELKQLVEGVRAIEQAMGSEKRILDDEKEIVAWARESVVSLRDIKKGSSITKDMVWVKRPGGGIPAKELGKVIGQKAKKDIPANSLIKLEDLYV
jgi:N-acetylneuraminate synthase